MAKTATAGAARKAPQSCQISELFRLLGAPHVLDILYYTIRKDGPARFKDYEADLGVSPNTLTGRLKELTAAGLLTRQAFNEIPPRVEYRASAKAIQFKPVFESLVDWSQRNNLQPIEATP